MKDPKKAEFISELKVIWEKLRSDPSPELMSKIMSKIQGRVQEIVFKHDSSRIIQTCIKHGNKEQRLVIASELKGSYYEMSKSKYGRFIVQKVLKYCPQAIRDQVIEEFEGKVRKAIRHKEASSVLDEIYSQYANAAQRMSLMTEFYGPEYAVFKTDSSAQSLKNLLEAHPVKKPYVLKHMKEMLDSVLEKATFNVGQTTILHRAILDYLTYAERSVFKEMIELLKDHLVHMLHTREGAQVVQLCLLHASSKDRKHIIKTLKSFVQAVAKEQYGHAVLITIFEVVDDTVLVTKAILSELFSIKVGEILRDQYASRVVLFLLNGREKKYQPQYLVEELEQMDAVRAETSKKEDSVRCAELQKGVESLLVEAVKENCMELVRSRQGASIIYETCRLFESNDSVKEILNQISDELGSSGAVSDEQVNEGPINVIKKMKLEKDDANLEAQGINLHESILKNRAAVTIIKALLKSDKKWAETFKNQVWEQLKDSFTQLINECAQNPGQTNGVAFILVALYECGDKKLQKSMKKAASKVKEDAEKLLVSFKESNKSNSKKRKADEGKESKTGIDILLNLL